MNCRICKAYVPQTFNFCPACGAPVTRELEAPRKRDTLIFRGEEIPVYVTDIHEFPVHSADSGRLSRKDDGKLYAEVVKGIRKFTVVEDR